MTVSVVQVIVDESTSKEITGTYEFSGDGSLLIPSGNAFPGTPTAKELFWRTDLAALYRRNDGDTAWEEVGGAGLAPLSGSGNPNGVVTTTLGRIYRDLTNGSTYTCTSNPSGSVWEVI